MNKSPLDKANELYLSVMKITGSFFNSKAVAILCVDELIKANPTELVDGSMFTIHPVNEMVKCDTTAYWQQVKQELQKM